MNTLSKYPIVQANGQHIYFPNPSDVTPPRGAEVYVGNLPQDVREDEIIPLFSQVGPIYQMRFMVGFDGGSRGFAFVCYRTPEDANVAVLLFHNHPIRRGAFIAVQLSLDNRKLFVGNIPRDRSAEEVQARLGKILEGVVHVMVYEEEADPRSNRGFAFVEFACHALAAVARRRLAAGECVWGRRKVVVNWAVPEPLVHPMVLMQIRTLYFGNIPLQCSHGRFREFMWMLVDRNEVERVYRKENYAFVHFKTREFAQQALRRLRSAYLTIHSRQITVEWARPAFYRRKTVQKAIQDNFFMEN